MKTFLVASVLAVAIAYVMAGDGDVLDEYDFDAIMNDKDQLKLMFECLMDKAPCGDKQKLRDVAPKLVASNCGDCTPEQKEKLEKVNKRGLEEYPKEYEQLIQKFSKPKAE